MNLVTAPWRRIFDYNGRSTRREFWLFVAIFYLGLGLCAALALAVDRPEPIAAAILLWGGACVFPFISLAVRRLHDHGKSGWFFALSWFPVFGWVFFLIMMLTPGDDYENGYGPDPRYAVDMAGDAAEVRA